MVEEVFGQDQPVGEQTRLLIERLRRGDSDAAILLDRLYRDALLRFLTLHLQLAPRIRR